MTTSTPSSVYSRVTLKDDTLGLGARSSQKLEGPPTGLVGFENLLGRLNGKSEEQLQKSQHVFDTLARGRYMQRRGVVNFVRGEILEHDEVKARSSSDRKADARPCDPAIVEKEDPQGKPENASNKTKVCEEPPMDLVQVRSETKAQKKARKEERRRQKGLRRNLNLVEKDPTSASRDEPKPPIDPAVAESLPQMKNNVVEQQRPLSQGPHLVRQKYIKQKKLAMMDTKALNEVGLPKSMKTIASIVLIHLRFS